MGSPEQNYKEEEPNYLIISEAHLAHNTISNYIIIKSSFRKAPSRQLKGLWAGRKRKLVMSEVIS